MSIDAQLLEQARSPDADQRHRAAVQLAQSNDEKDLDLAFELLGDRDWRVRKAIVEGLLRNTSESIVRRLIRELHDSENAGKRNSATEAILRIGVLALPVLLESLRNEIDGDVRLSLVNILGDIRSDEALDALLELIRTETDVNIVSSAVASIGKYRQAKAVRQLMELLARDDLWLKFHVIEALGEIGDRGALPAILPLYAEQSLRKPVLEAIGKIADVGTINFLLRIISTEEKLNLAALRALTQIAHAEKPKVVEMAERHLIQKKFREAFPKAKLGPLIDHLHSTTKREVKSFLLMFLGWSGEREAVPTLLEHLEHPETADVAAQALIDFGRGAAPAVIERLANGSDEDEVTAALIKIAHFVAGPEGVPTILRYLDHDNSMIRRLAIEALGEIPDPSTIDYLLAKLDDFDSGCQQAAVNSICSLVAAFPEAKAETLAKIRRFLASNELATKLNSLSIFVNIQGEGYHDELLLASKDEDPVIRQKAISLMGKFGEERFADQLVLSLADESTAVRVAAIEAIVKLRPEKGLEPLISSLEDSDIWIRTAAAQALGEYREPAAIAPLLRHLETDAVPVKIAIIEALGKSESPSVKDELVAHLDESYDVEVRRATILSLARIPGEDVFQQLLSSLRSGDWRLRAAAAISLGSRGDERALDVLHAALLRDSDPFVQQSVVVALDKIGSRTSFPYLLKAIENQSVLDEVSHLFTRHRETYRDLLEDAWRKADSRQEVIIAAILQAMGSR